MFLLGSPLCCIGDVSYTENIRITELITRYSHHGKKEIGTAKEKKKRWLES
jgi:hypothetical protein